ncbi:glycine-rich protein, partial [Kitasatospora purpeofusca]|uniref:glycine-rich protein n=1 Tax=Kitasatospora purpeofusca TaxID=67352 RepID=UPI00381A9478
MAPVRSLLGGRFRTAMRGALALLCLVPQGGLALAAAPPAYGPQGLPREQRALTACTPSGSFTNCARVTYSGGDQTFTVPAGVTAVYARVFGAGGAGSPRDYYTGQYGGGGGGYTTGTLAVTPGQALTLTVGQGGRLNSTTSTYGGGGAGGQGYTAANGSNATGGSGGGMSAVWNGASGTNPLVVAGGGGGSSPGADATTPAAGGGGGSNGGQDNQPAASGRGGTQSAGGAAATQTACAAATAGAQYQGGRGASSPQNEGGGGGGGGYYGGGGGACQRGGTLDANGMGGGGSGYNRGTGVTNTQTSNGTNSSGNGVGGTSGGRGDAQYTSGSGIGDGGGYTNGGNGEIVLEWVTQVGLSVKKTASPTTYVPGQRLTYTFVVSNAGPAPAVNAPVRDALPSALSGFTWTCASGGTGSTCGAASGTGNLDTTATIAANSSVTYTVTGIVPSATTGTLSNTATVTRPAASTDPNCGPTCSSTVDTPGRVTTGLSVTKTPDKNPYVPGQPLTYTIVVKNDGPSDAIGTSVKDTLPTTIRNFSWTCTAAGGGSCGSPASGTGDINTTVDLPAGGQVTYRLTGTVPADATGSLDNRATVTPPGGTTDPNCSPSCTSTANPVPPGNQANLVVSKTLLTSPVVPGQQIKWQVKVTNNGPSRARNVVVTDQVPAGVTAASMANDQDGAACPISGGTATCPAVEIAVNGTASWTLTGTLDPNATATPTNTALVTGGPDPSASTRTAVASPTASPSPQANLTISKTLLTNPVVPGAQIQWRVTVTNNGPSRARNVVVTDQVPTGVTGATMRQGVDGADCPISGGTATCPAVEIAAGSSQTWTLTGTLDPNATVTPTNTAVVTGGPDPGATARTAVASPTASPSPQANLTVSKSLLTSPVVPGQPVQWRVTVTNNGPSRARNVVITDTVPAGVSGATMTADTGGANCPISGGTATCPAVEIPAGSSLSWTLTGTLDANATTTPTNTVTVTGGPDPAASTRTAVASPTASPSPQANLKVSKSLVTNPVVPGQRIEWRVNVLNSGPSRARNVVVADTVPAGVTNPVMTAPDGTTCPISGGVATCPGVEIPAGQALNWTLTGTLDPNATATPTNTVTVTGGPDPTASTHTAVASPSGSPSPQTDLTVSKVLLTNPVVPGQQIQWRVTVTNNGPSRARDIVVRDQVPTGVTGATMTADTGGANCPITSGVATCPAVEIPAGSSLSWTLTGTLDANATTTPANTVTVTGGPDPATPTHTAVASPSGSPSPQANLTVSKVLLTDPVVPGRQIQWRVTVTNNGPSRARNVVVADTVPAGVTNPVMTASDGTTCPISGGVATCPAVEIPAGSSQTWTLTGTLASDATSTPVNSVTVTGGPDPAASTRTAVASPTASPSPQANLTVSKVLLTNPVVPGQQIQWRVTVTNNGPSRARDVVVRDQVPAGVTGPAMSADTGGANCPITSGVATCPAVEIPAGSSLSWTLTGTLDANATTTPANTVTVTGGPDPATPTHTAVASPSGSPSPQANLTASKVLLTNPVVPGQQIQWRVTVTNNGPSRARDVVVRDQVPAGVTGPTMTADTGGANCPITSGVATCPAVEIPAGSSLSWTLSGTLTADATVTPTNTATVTGGPDTATPTHTAVASPTNSPSPQANLTTSKVLLTNPVVPGQQIQWRVSVTNNGPSLARNVVVTDTVPAGVGSASMAAADGTPCPISNGTATCPAVEIPAGATLTWTLTGTLDANATTTPTNTATVTGGPDPATPTHTAVASPTNSPSAQANLTTSKVLLTNPVVPGQQIQWRVSVTNNGPSRARDVVVTDTVPAGVNNPAMTAADGTPCPINNGTATCPAVEIPVGQTLTWTLTGTLAQDATVTPTNTATVTGGPDPATPTHTAVASPTNSPSPQANLTTSKVLLTNPVIPGQQIQWRVSVTNNGPSRARNVIVTDQVPAGVGNASMTSDAGGAGCPIANALATCPAVEIPVGQTLTWTLTGTLDANATVTPTNTAIVTGGPDPATPTHTAVASPTNTPSTQANLTASKILLTNPVVPGQQIQWRVSVTNNGPSRARDVVVTDTVPAGVTGASMKADADNTPCPINNSTATCPAVEIPVGQTLTWTLTGTLDANATMTPTNTATVTGGPDPATPTHTAVASPSNSPSAQANLTTSKVLVTNPVVPGQQIQWQVTVTNNGPSRARDVVVTDTVPAGVNNAAMTAADGTNCPINNGTATCPAVEIPVGATMTWTLTGTLDANATVTPTNTATVTGGPDPTTPTHTAVASPSNSPSTQAILTTSKVLLTNPVIPGQQIQWQVNVTNNGPSRARDVVVTDTVPAGVTGASMKADANNTPCPINNGTATCPAVEIPVGQTLTWTLTGTLDANTTTTPTNTATVTGGPDPATPTHTAVASPTNTPSTQANLTVSKSLLTNPVVPGQQIQWQVNVTNNGPSRARDVVVTDTVPAGVTGASMKADADNTPCPINNGTATCPAVEIPVGATMTWTLTGTLDANTTTTPTNTATVTGGPDPATPTHTA